MLGPPWCRLLGGSAACRGNKLLLSLCSGDLSSAPGEAGSPPPLSLSLVLQTIHRRSCTITKKAPSRSFSSFKKGTA